MTNENRKEFGQFMTPEHVSRLLAAQLPPTAESVIDLAAGDGSLLTAVLSLRRNTQVYGFEIDPQFYDKATRRLPNATLLKTDGLSADLPSMIKGSCVVGNPPFTEIEPSCGMKEILDAGFPGLSTRLGRKRAELYFLARSLLIAKRHNGYVVILMPMGFADGDIYRHYRNILMRHYSLLRVIEVSAGTFNATEARTIMLVIDTSMPGSKRTEVCRFSEATQTLEEVFVGALVPGERLDARYHEGKSKIPSNTLNLQDIGVTIVRGRFSRKDSERLGIDAVHTTDLGKAKSGELHLKSSGSIYKSLDSKSIYAEPGDILLPRTGSRVSWKPIVVQSGMQPITDHVFRIRAPLISKDKVLHAFEHPEFADWLYSVSKGVCATVLTKRELLTMPLFQ